LIEIEEKGKNFCIGCVLRGGVKTEGGLKQILVTGAGQRTQSSRVSDEGKERLGQNHRKLPIVQEIKSIRREKGRKKITKMAQTPEKESKTTVVLNHRAGKGIPIFWVQIVARKGGPGHGEEKRQPGLSISALRKVCKLGRVR